jgi:Outer membrane protein beta-barrel domain
MKAKAASLVLFVLLASGGWAIGFADDPLGFYIGAAVGEAHVRTDNVAFGSTGNEGVIDLGKFQFDEQHTAWKAIAGVRPISLLGVELEYIDFGNPRTGYAHDSSIGFSLVGASAEARAGAAFALGYLPLPVPYLDIYGKLGVARLHTTSTEVPELPFSCVVGAPCFPLGSVFYQSNWSTNLAYGLGVQGKLGRLAVRAEYERISVSGGDPDLFSVGATWTF